MSKAVAERETVVSADAHMSKLGKDYSSDGDADPETGDVEPLPTQMGMEISFKDLTYTVDNSAKRGDKLALLRDVSGFFLPGQMSALMGPSGSGKTTLLDVLAGRKTVGSISGTIGFAGRQPTRTFLRRYAGYVEQFDTLIPNLTVYEMLMYTAELKNSRKMPIAEKRAKVEAAVRALALDTCRDVRIGDPLNRGISGGQAKRTNIGLALVTSPRVLFLDEPTSGLDSFTANEVMAEVKALVRGGITICATIHSPTPFAFGLFDALIILLRGRVVYFGDRGAAAVDYFQRVLPSASDTARSDTARSDNEAEWIVNLTTRGDRAGRAEEFAQLYEASSLRRENDNRLEQVGVARSKLSLELQRELDVQTATTTPFWFAFLTLHKYRSTRDFRDPRFIGPRTADKLLVSLIMATLYWKQGKRTDPGSVSNVTSLLFMWIVMPAFTAVAYVPALILERPLFLRERNDGLYRVITYLSFKISAEVAMQVVNSVVFSLLVFYVVRLHGAYTVFWLVYLITSCCGVIIAYFIAALAPTMEVANAAVPAYVVTLLYFVGLLIRKQDMHAYWRWYTWLDPLHYAWTALVLNQYDGTDILYNGVTVPVFFDIDGVHKWGQVGFESLFFAGFFGLAWVALTFRRYGSR